MEDKLRPANAAIKGLNACTRRTGRRGDYGSRAQTIFVNRCSASASGDERRHAD